MSHQQWKKDLGPHYISDRDFLVVAIILFLFIGIFYSHPILYIFLGVLITYLLMNYFYNRFLGKKLYLEPERQTIRLFQGDKGEFSFEFHNDSYLPMLNGQLRFQITPIISPLEGDVTAEERNFAFLKSFSLRARGKTKIVFPFQAEKRGATRVRNITYSFPHLLNFNVVTLKYVPFTLKEVVIFPKPLKVENVELAFQQSPGKQLINLSPFEDIQSPISIRDYEYSDPFYRINWKASAKTQQLQTNVYEKVVDSSYLFLVNIRSTREVIQSNEEMERILSYTTYLCQQAFEKEIPYEMYINARTASETPFLHRPEGEGRVHYLNTLEMLARIPRHSMFYPFHKMIYWVEKKISTPKTIVVVGDVSQEIGKILAKFHRKQGDIYHLNPHHKKVKMEKWQGDVRLHA